MSCSGPWMIKVVHILMDHLRAQYITVELPKVNESYKLGSWLMGHAIAFLWSTKLQKAPSTPVSSTRPSGPSQHAIIERKKYDIIKILY